MKYRFFAIFLALVMAFGLAVPQTVSAAEADEINLDDINWDELSEEDLAALAILGIVLGGDDDDHGGHDHYFDEYGYEDYYAYVTASCANGTINVGASTAAQAYISTNASSASLEVRWSSSNNSVASVSGDGNYAYVHGRKAGSATITTDLYMEGVKVDTDSFSVTVRQPAPQYVSVNGISVS
ncbi:MAG: Ig-like domain-containing protein, partial [Eubacterium sp.]|nr:Ig-like domain-containing protein [Eubacterium sp.]